MLMAKSYISMKSPYFNYANLGKKSSPKRKIKIIAIAKNTRIKNNSYPWWWHMGGGKCFG